MRLIVLLMSLLPLAACAPRPVDPAAGTGTLAANDNRLPAGTLRDGVLSLRLGVEDAAWQAEQALPAWPVLAFAEEGKPASTPGPLIRVARGTIVDVGIRNPGAGDLWVHGLYARSGADAPLRVPARGSAHARFVADTIGTFYYWGTLGKPFDKREGHDSELNGALIVDAPDARADDRIFVISRHGGANEGGDGVGAWSINGRSWPQTERLTYGVGEQVAWRWINATGHRHPMHLHGMFFRVARSGDNATDRPRAPGEQNDVVTEVLAPGGTAAMTWSPDRPGNWLFHCHILFHVIPENRIPEPAWYDEYAELPHDQHMAGLVLGIHVPDGAVTPHDDAPSPPRAIAMRVAERPGIRFDDYYQRPVPGVGYSVDGSAVSAPGPVLELVRGRPVEIAIRNELTHATSVHWHGIEVQCSYYDGVPHWGVDGDRVTPWIDPGGSFIARFTPPRAGTYMYHTHFNDYAQLTAGLYGALIVVEPGHPLDAAVDHVVVLSQGPDDMNDPILLNGTTAPPPSRWSTGSRHRLRLIGVSAVQTVRVRLTHAGQPVTWRALAKDGADLPGALATLRSAELDISPGETYDFEFTSNAAIALRFEANVSKRDSPQTIARIDVE